MFLSTSAPNILHLIFYSCRHAAVTCYRSTTVSSCGITQKQLYLQDFFCWTGTKVVCKQIPAYMNYCTWLIFPVRNQGFCLQEHYWSKQSFAEPCPKTLTNHFLNWQRCLRREDTDLVRPSFPSCGMGSFSFRPQHVLSNVTLNFSYFFWSSRALFAFTVEQAESESKLLHAIFRHISGIYFNMHVLGYNHSRCSQSYSLPPFLSPHKTVTVALSFMGWGNEGMGGTSRNF